MLNKKYQSQSNVIASYDYTDIADGTGYVEYYAESSYDTTTHFLFSEPLYGTYYVVDSGMKTNTDYEVVCDRDFDLSPFNAPRTIRGKLYANVAHYSTDAGAAGDVSSYVKVLVRKWDGTTETEIANGTGAVLSNPAGGDQAVGQCTSIIVDIADKHHFKKGEQLRITINVYAKKSSANNYACYLIYDPLNRDWAPITPSTDEYDFTFLKVYVPFDLDVE